MLDYGTAKKIAPRPSTEKFRQLFLREFGVELTDEQAEEEAQRFLNLARIVMQPMPKRLENRYKEIFQERHSV